MKITVTAEDIENGQCKIANKCPVALSLKRSTGTEWFVRTRRFERWSADGFIPGQSIPPEVAAFVAVFDSGSPVKPFTFEFDVEVT